MADKSEGAFLTIGELADELGLPQHILRYWETRFPQLRPLQRAGKRRYYRPADVTLAKRIDQLLNHEGYTIKGVQKLLSQRAPKANGPAEESVEPEAVPAPAPASVAVDAVQLQGTSSEMLAELKRLRATLAQALAAA